MFEALEDLSHDFIEPTCTTCFCRSAAQAEVLHPRDRPAFINVTMVFLEHCDWLQVAVAPKHSECPRVANRKTLHVQLVAVLVALSAV